MKKIKRLKLSLWEEIIYFLLVVIGPAVVTCVELFQSHSTVLKVSFASIGALLITAIVVKKFFIRNIIEKWQKEIAALEHDYSIEVGDADSCKQQWVFYNIFIYAHNAIYVLLAMVLFALFAKALSDGLMQFKGASLIILLCVFVGILFKIICYIAYLKSNVSTTEETTSESK